MDFLHQKGVLWIYRFNACCFYRTYSYSTDTQANIINRKKDQRWAELK